MNNALLAGVSGLKAHQQMLDVAGHNLSNVNTTGFKSSRVTFAELLSQTLRPASQPTTSTGGTNPMQIGSGVQVGSVDRNMAQGSLLNTGQELDMALEGAGYFVFNDGQKEVYTRVGSLAVDSLYFLVDPGTGYRLQRIGSAGVAEGFQDAASDDIRIPYDVALPAQDTTNIQYTGNVSADAVDPTTHRLTSVVQYTAGGTVASDATPLDQLDQGGSTLQDGDTLVISGFQCDGTPVGPSTWDIYSGGVSKTVGDLLTEIETLFPGCTATMTNGEIRLTDDQSGYSQTDLLLEMGGGSAGTLTLPDYFKILSAGGEASWDTNVEIFDSQGIAHTLSAAFVRSDAGTNEWDLVLTDITGDVTLHDRRVKGVCFLADGAYGGMSGADPASFQMEFAHDPGSVRTITLDLGTVGEFDGLSQFGGPFTVSPTGQDGYASGWLNTLSVSRQGVLVGVFTNGIRRDVAAIKIATFQNPAGLESIGNNYFSTSANSGNPVAGQALSGGAGAVRGGALEKSNVEVAGEFVNMIQAQNGFQANARTIRVANEMLRELTNLIR